MLLTFSAQGLGMLTILQRLGQSHTVKNDLTQNADSASAENYLLLICTSVVFFSFFFWITLFFWFFKNLFIYLFLAALGLSCCARTFSSCSKRGLLFVAVRGLLIAVASLVAEHRL